MRHYIASEFELWHTVMFYVRDIVYILSSKPLCMKHSVKNNYALYVIFQIEGLMPIFITC
jgi:hypothetical protein